MIKSCSYPCTSQPPITATPLVLLHGWGTNTLVWQSLIPQLQALAPIISIDFSSAYHEPKSIVTKIIQQVTQQTKLPVVICGWSLGGMLATQIAAQHPKLAVGLITLAANTQFVACPHWPEAMDKSTYQDFYTAIQNNPTKALKRFMSLIAQGDEYLRQQQRFLNVLKLSASAVKGSMLLAGLELLHSIHNQAIIPHIQCASLHIFGECDHLVPLGVAQRIQTLNPQHNTAILSNTSHLLHIPEERLVNVIEPFLRENLRKQTSHLVS